MQVLLVDATGKPFPELMQSLVLKPLGMGGKRLSTAPKRQAQVRQSPGPRQQGTTFQRALEGLSGTGSGGPMEHTDGSGPTGEFTTENQSWPRHQAVHQGLYKRAFKSCRYQIF